MTTHHISAAPGDFAPVVLMPGDPLRARYIAETHLDGADLVTSVRNMEGYTGTYKGQPHILDDGARYFGPYTMASAAYQSLDTVRRFFPYLTCTRTITGQDERACLYYHIGR